MRRTARYERRTAFGAAQVPRGPHGEPASDSDDDSDAEWQRTLDEIRESSVFAMHTEHLLSPKVRERRRRRVTHAQLRRAGVDVSTTSGSDSSAASDDDDDDSSESNDEDVDEDFLYDLRRRARAS